MHNKEGPSANEMECRTGFWLTLAMRGGKEVAQLFPQFGCSPNLAEHLSCGSAGWRNGVGWGDGSLKTGVPNLWAVAPLVGRDGFATGLQKQLARARAPCTSILMCVRSGRACALHSSERCARCSSKWSCTRVCALGQSLAWNHPPLPPGPQSQKCGGTLG